MFDLVIKVLIKSNKARNEDDLYARSKAPIEGLVGNRIASLGSDERRWLADRLRRPAAELRR